MNIVKNEMQYHKSSMSYYYHQMDNYKIAVEMVTASGVHYLMMSSVFVVVVDIVEDEKEHYCDVVPLCLFDQLLRIINCTCNKYSNITITNHVVVSAAVTVELDVVTSKVNLYNSHIPYIANC